MMMVEEDDFQQAADSYTGWCTSCLEFQGECVEPDAEGYKCPSCGNMTVMGAEQALIEGVISF